METYSHLHAYDNPSGLDLPDASDSATIPKKMYVDFDIPSRGTLRRHRTRAHISKNLCREIRENAQNDQRGIKERKFGRFAKIPADNTFNELLTMNFADVAGSCKFAPYTR